MLLVGSLDEAESTCSCPYLNVYCLLLDAARSNHVSPDIKGFEGPEAYDTANIIVRFANGKIQVIPFFSSLLIEFPEI